MIGWHAAVWANLATTAYGILAGDPLFAVSGMAGFLSSLVGLWSEAAVRG